MIPASMQVDSSLPAVGVKTFIAFSAQHALYHYAAVHRRTLGYLAARRFQRTLENLDPGLFVALNIWPLPSLPR